MCMHCLVSLGDPSSVSSFREDLGADPGSLIYDRHCAFSAGSTDYACKQKVSEKSRSNGVPHLLDHALAEQI